MWLNNYGTEVMIWVDNHGQRPAGNVIGHATIFGQHFAVWHGGTDYTFALDRNETTGMTQILPSIRWLMERGYVPGQRDSHAGRLRMGNRLHRRQPDGLHDYQVLAIHPRMTTAESPPRRILHRATAAPSGAAAYGGTAVPPGAVAPCASVPPGTGRLRTS